MGKRRISAALAVTAVLMLTVGSSSATRIAGREVWLDVKVESATVALGTILVTTGTGQSAQIGTGPTETVNFTCDAVAIGTKVVSTGILKCYMVGQTYGDVHAVPDLPKYRPGYTASVSKTFSGKTQPYKLCKQGGWIDNSGKPHAGSFSCAFPL